MGIFDWQKTPFPYFVEFHFERAPKWLQRIASIQILNRYALAMAYKRGLYSLKESPTGSERPDAIAATGKSLSQLEAEGWRDPYSGETIRDKYRHGSISKLK